MFALAIDDASDIAIATSGIPYGLHFNMLIIRITYLHRIQINSDIKSARASLIDQIQNRLGSDQFDVVCHT
ncbi:hypothetical protein BDI4_20004 [Burkholderia diffusa]|nr:hypothetical protein BDI4_20004 [Burkholderia diffusa]